MSGSILEERIEAKKFDQLCHQVVQLLALSQFKQSDSQGRYSTMNQHPVESSQKFSSKILSDASVARFSWHCVQK